MNEEEFKEDYEKFCHIKDAFRHYTNIAFSKKPEKNSNSMDQRHTHFFGANHFYNFNLNKDFEN